MNNSLPLLDIFSKLRVFDFQIGVPEYLVAVKALSKGFGANSRKKFVFMCQTVWGKTKEEQSQIAQEINKVLPKELTEDEFNRLISQFQPKNQEGSSEKTKFKSKDSVEQTKPQEINKKPVDSSESKPPETERPSRSPNQQRKAGPDTKIKKTPESGLSGAKLGDPEIQNFQLDPNFDFTGSLPITRRQMKRAWSYYRRMRRIGPPVELDIRETIGQMYRTGSIAKLIFIPRLRNMARMLILKDEGGSMTPFRYITQEIINSAMRSGFAKTSVFYFHNVPENDLFCEPMLKSKKEIKQLMEDFTNDGVLIVSDAGSARGGYNTDRVEETQAVIQLIRRFTLNIAWLNPTPEGRWEDTTADLIRHKCQVPMFTMDRTGLHKAVNALRAR